MRSAVVAGSIRMRCGAGGLGSPAAFYLAAAGVGAIRLIDDDVVERSNLQRQILHRDDRIGARKVDSAAATLSALNPTVRIEPIATRLSAANAAELREILNVSQLSIEPGAGFAARVERAGGTKCERCWHWEHDVGQSAAHPTLCARCSTAVTMS